MTANERFNEIMKDYPRLKEDFASQIIWIHARTGYFIIGNVEAAERLAQTIANEGGGDCGVIMQELWSRRIGGLYRKRGQVKS